MNEYTECHDCARKVTELTNKVVVSLDLQCTIFKSQRSMTMSVIHALREQLAKLKNQSTLSHFNSHYSF
jgi:hypothetical protein